MLCVNAVIKNQASLQQAGFATDIILPSKPSKEDKEAWESVKDSLIDLMFWQQARQLQLLLKPLLKVTVSLETSQPRLSHIYADMTWLLQEEQKSELVPPLAIKTIIQRRFEKVYHPLIIIAFLANPSERHRRPALKVGEAQFRGLATFLMQYCNQDKARASLLYAKLAQLRTLSGIFNDEMAWSAGKDQTMSPIAWWQSFFIESEPELAELCILSLAITPTTGAAERNWSAYGFIHDLKRNALSHDMVERLVYLFWNLKIKHQ